MGTSVARANLTLGFNEWAMGTSGATGILDALESAATVNLHLDELNIGRSARGQTSTGILRWNQSEVIDATTIYLSRGSGAVGQIETPSGGTLLLGTATEQVSNLRIGWNASQVAGAASGTLDLAAANPIFEAHIGSDLTLGRTTGGASFGANPGSADGTLILGSNSTLNVGTSVARANLTLGFNEWAMGTSGATGILDALESAATVNLHLDELNIGRSARGQTSTGILRWNQSEVIDATTIYLSRGSGAVGQIETPSGGTLLLGTATEQVSNLRIGWNASQVAGAASGTLDLAAANPIFEAHIGSDLTLGRTTGGASFGANPGSADGTLILGSNSTLNVGTSVARANLTLGFNEWAMGTSGATGILDAREGATDMHLDVLTIGGSSRGQIATGTFIVGRRGHHQRKHCRDRHRIRRHGNPHLRRQLRRRLRSGYGQPYRRSFRLRQQHAHDRHRWEHPGDSFQSR